MACEAIKSCASRILENYLVKSKKEVIDRNPCKVTNVKCKKNFLFQNPHKFTCAKCKKKFLSKNPSKFTRVKGKKIKKFQCSKSSPIYTREIQ